MVICLGLHLHMFGWWFNITRSMCKSHNMVGITFACTAGVPDTSKQ